ncbi:hypothetical protein KDW_60310 [Dictyobacter vulcani]|uniref:Uncharacterized protein n=1 Tax=Dictyobacter vulcani TaxID=2607529 RepID=A0A5J4L0Q3_9CHLR|nr:hypothetical protein KDW_60310 [Dictyobacter vulcani]
MSHQPGHPPAANQGNKYYGQTSTPLQPTPGRPRQLPAVLPLTRRTSKKQQVLAMLLYSLISILILVSCLFTINSNIDKDPNSWFGLIKFCQTVVLVCVLAPATTLLCAALFGSWRGALVSCISIYSSIQITHLLNNHFWIDMSLASFWFLIPVFIVILLVGLSYDLRKYVGAPINVIVILLGALVLVVVLLFIAWKNGDPNGPVTMLYGGIVLIAPLWGLLTAGVEEIIQKCLA